MAVPGEMSTGVSNDSGSGEILDRGVGEAAPPVPEFKVRTSGAILAQALWDAETMLAAQGPPVGLTAFDAGRWRELKRHPETADQKRKRSQGRLNVLAALPVNLRAAHEDEYEVLRRQAAKL